MCWSWPLNLLPFGHDGAYQPTCNRNCPQASGYTNLGQHALGRARIININQFSLSDPLEELQKFCSPSAAFDSAARSSNPPPQCLKSTRLSIIQSIEEWINTDRVGDSAVPSSVFWLYGGAGVGKSAIAQSLSEEFKNKGKLAASFFFSRNDPSRNNREHLFPTLISQLADTFKDMRPFIRAKIRDNPALLTKRSEIQIQELLIEPLLTLQLSNESPRLIVIDGLNECQIPDAQPECELLRLIARAVRRFPYPFRFLITSRPESHIMDVFKHDRDLQAITVHSYNLSDDPDADMDIRTFLEREFAEIRRVHRLGRCLPAWPERKAITSLVERSSRHFIFASTVIKYIRSPNHRPNDRLEVILRRRPPQEGDRPYAQLDALYESIFAGVQNQNQLENICLVLGILYLRSRNFESVHGCTIEELLEMKAGDLELLLGPIASLVSIDAGGIRVLHESLFDFLLDFDRSRLPFDLTRAHTVAATHILKQKIVIPVGDLDDFLCFAWHCRFAHPNDTLRDYLHSLDVPFPDSIVATPTNLSAHDGGILSLSIIWHVFRTLSREDFDSTRQLYKHYLAKWIHYLRPTCTKYPSGAVAVVPQKMNDLKSELDGLLMEWKPPKLTQNPMVVGTDPSGTHQRVDFIKQEHMIFSSYAEASLSGYANTLASTSSLVFSADFIHGYNLWIRGGQSFLHIRTYSRHRDISFAYGFGGYIDVVESATVYQAKAEKCLVSNLYRRYGIMPEEVQVHTQIGKALCEKPPPRYWALNTKKWWYTQ